jgi:hypothetical protein
VESWDKGGTTTLFVCNTRGGQAVTRFPPLVSQLVQLVHRRWIAGLAGTTASTTPRASSPRRTHFPPCASLSSEAYPCSPIHLSTCCTPYGDKAKLGEVDKVERELATPLVYKADRVTTRCSQLVHTVLTHLVHLIHQRWTGGEVGKEGRQCVQAGTYW